ncbi:substrate-binding periplasmic protein [Alkalimarinus sediminis]|uniref:Transporter substrate-binding domain-containing protein n=1 Tax=Alkalimarinus sediminis TaxID=1632866 RepID=A0A9E8KP52_9ALTE|nr:transporter substrate-binding domain-containing protein [Alkalimarinus sediminis]UZW74389.1 transporter substrate-binding domain-containing protein [Alkalimarinus sediminis]
MIFAPLKQTGRHRIVVHIGIIFSLLIAFSDLHAETLKVATGEWVPYVSESYQHHGAIGHVIETIYQAEGIDVEFGYFPWARGYQMAKDGIWEAIMPYYCSPEREMHFYCSEPIVSGQLVYFHRTDYPFEWRTIDDLKGLNVGGTLGYYYGEAFEKAEREKQFKVQRIASDETNFMVLMKGRIQVFPQDKEVGYAMIRRLFSEEEQKFITHHPAPIHTKSLHLLFARNNEKSKRYLDMFNQGLKRLQDSGELKGYLDAMSSGVYVEGGAYGE